MLIFWVDFCLFLFCRVFFALAFCAASVGSASAYTQDYNKAKLAAAQLFQLIDKKSDIDVVSCMGAKPVSEKDEMINHRFTLILPILA